MNNKNLQQKYENVSKNLYLSLNLQDSRITKTLNLTRNSFWCESNIKSYWRLKKEDCLLFIFTRRIIEECKRGNNIMWIYSITFTDSNI